MKRLKSPGFSGFKYFLQNIIETYSKKTDELFHLKSKNRQYSTVLQYITYICHLKCVMK